MTALAPHEAFDLAARLTLVDASIRARANLLDAAIVLLDLSAALRLAERLDEALDERYALTRKDTREPATG